MALFGNKNRKPNDTPFLAPEPEGPEEVARKFQRSRDGRSGASKRKLLEKSGLEEIPPARRFLISAIITAEVAMIGLNFFTDTNFPAGWFFGIAVPLIALLVHKDENEETE